jgi:hypothetical protein
MKVSDIAKKTVAGRKVFSYLSTRERHRNRTDLRQLYTSVFEEGDSTSYEDFIKVFQELHNAQVGVLIRGRRNDPDRFQWRYNLKDVAKAAKGEIELGEAPKAEPVSGNNKGVVVAPGANVIQINLHVSGDKSAQLSALLQLAKSLAD